MSITHHRWTKTTLGQDRCWQCGAARMRFRTVHHTSKVRTLYWTPKGWVFDRPSCKRAALRASAEKGGTDG